MRRAEPNPASAKEQAEGSRENVNTERDTHKRGSHGGRDDFEPHTDLPGRTDSGPEPEVHKQSSGDSRP
jgi:hypothetical protein